MLEPYATPPTSPHFSVIFPSTFLYMLDTFFMLFPLLCSLHSFISLSSFRYSSFCISFPHPFSFCLSNLLSLSILVSSILSLVPPPCLFPVSHFSPALCRASGIQRYSFHQTSAVPKVKLAEINGKHIGLPVKWGGMIC